MKHQIWLIVAATLVYAAPVAAEPSLETVRAHITAERYDMALAELTVLASKKLDSDWFFYKAQVQYRRGWCKAANADAAISLQLATSAKDVLRKNLESLQEKCKSAWSKRIITVGTQTLSGQVIIAGCGKGGGFTGHTDPFATRFQNGVPRTPPPPAQIR